MESGSEVFVEDGVHHWVHGAVAVAQPDYEGVHFGRGVLASVAEGHNHVPATSNSHDQALNSYALKTI